MVETLQKPVSIWIGSVSLEMYSLQRMLSKSSEISSSASETEDNVRNGMRTYDFCQKGEVIPVRKGLDSP